MFSSISGLCTTDASGSASLPNFDNQKRLQTLLDVTKEACEIALPWEPPLLSRLYKGHLTQPWDDCGEGEIQGEREGSEAGGRLLEVMPKQRCWERVGGSPPEGRHTRSEAFLKAEGKENSGSSVWKFNLLYFVGHLLSTYHMPGAQKTNVQMSSQPS